MLEWALNVVVVRSGGRTILIDAGLGVDPNLNLPRAGRLALRLEAAGIDLSSVTDGSGLPDPRGPAILSRMGTKSRETIYGASVRAAAERATEARKGADRLAVAAWNKRILGFQGPAQPSPTQGAINAGCGEVSHQMSKEEAMTYVSCLRFAVLASAAFLSGTPAFAQSTSVSTEYLMTVYIQKDPALVADLNLVISRDQTGGWIKGKVSGRLLAPSADWVTRLPGDALRLRLDARVTIETDEQEIIYMSYNGRMHCDKENTDRFRKGEVVKAEDCYLISAPTFQTKSEKYSWLNDIQAVGKMVEYKNSDHLIYDLFVVK